MSAGASETWITCTDRLRLRLLLAADAVALREVTGPGMVEAVVAQAEDRALTPWAIVMRDGGAVVGFCGFFVRPVKGTTMGYGIVSEYRGRGLATEAAAAVLDWAGRHDVDVYSSVRPPNPASVRVLEKIGMRLVASYHDEDGQRDIYRR
jgi:RimJ/RimL family protein N-acetyltransferase